MIKKNNLYKFWKFNTNLNNVQDIRGLNLNFGPQHPASHGVLRIILQLSGEVIKRVDTHIGLLHRGSEKLIENNTYLSGLPYFDRMDYVSVLTQEHAYCLAIEELIGTNQYRAEHVQVRVLFDELTRILNHLMAVSTHALDVGSMNSVFWFFEERENIMEFYERVSGARMHAAFYRPNDLSLDYITENLLRDILIFSRSFLKRLSAVESKLASSNIWRYRLSNIGILQKNLIGSYGISGVLARSAGIKRDLRLSYSESYSNYYFLKIRSYIGYTGDCYDRYLIRMREMAESLHIIAQVINNLRINTYYLNSNKNSNLFNNDFLQFYNNISPIIMGPLKKSGMLSTYTSMEEVINHFQYYSIGFSVPAGSAYRSVESPKGEFGVSLVSDGSGVPYRCKVKPVSYYHLQVLNVMLENSLFQDLITIIGSQDLVLGEVDR